MADSPAITVCMLCFNDVDNLEESIESVLALGQTFPTEVVVTDNLSHDGSEKVLRQYADSGRITLVTLKGSRGTCRQAAFERARGRYVVCHMDCDDVFDPVAIARFISDYFKENDGLMVMSKKGGEEASNVTISPRELVQRIGGWRDINWGEDWDLWERAYEIGKYRFVPYPSAPLHKIIRVRVERQKGLGKLRFRYLRYKDMIRMGRLPFHRGEHRSLAQLAPLGVARLSVFLSRSKLEPVKFNDFNDRAES